MIQRRRRLLTSAAVALAAGATCWICLGQREELLGSHHPPATLALGAFVGGCAPPHSGNRAPETSLNAADEESVKPTLNYPPPAASVTWPRWLSLLATTYAALQGFRRKLFGGAEAVALDPALPWSVRWELIRSRKDLRAKGKQAPRAFQSMLKESADTLEELPALLVTVAVLAGELLRRSKEPKVMLAPFRKLGEAQALLFTAGKLHLGMPGGVGTMRLLGGDFLFAEGQWTMAELGSLPAIRRTAQMIREVSDGTSEGGPAYDTLGKMGDCGAKAALRAAFLRAGTYFATVTSSAGWMSGAPKATVAALRRYGTDFGCALQLAQYRDDVASQDLALWLARSAQEALLELGESMQDSSAVRGMRRLAHRVERSCKTTLSKLMKEQSGHGKHGLSFGEFRELRRELDEDVLPGQGRQDGDDERMASGPGFQRDGVADRELEDLIGAGLHGSAPASTLPITWSTDAGPKATLEGKLRFIGRELMEVNGLLDGTLLAQPADTNVVRETVLKLFATSGKRLRPALVLLVARALEAPKESLSQVASLAASVEVLHCASLVHDDILDGAEFRRGEPTAHVVIGDRPATLVGDFLFATASVLVAQLGSMPVVLLISKVVADFGRGELAQSAVRFEAVDYSLEDYLAKSFYKTASLLAAACQAAAVLSGVAPDSKEAIACYRFGAYIGLAFQVVDDILDFVSTEEELGKPALADLKEGNLSAPVLFAAQEKVGMHGGHPLATDPRRELVETLERRLSQEGDLDKVLALVEEAKGVEQAKSLARRFADLAIAELAVLPEGEAREGLHIFAEFVVARTS